MEKRGPDYIPYDVWSTTAERKRNHRTWVIGVSTAVVVLGVGIVLMVPILNRRAVIDNLVKKFDESKQVVTHENHIGPIGLAFDYRKLEEADRFRRIEMEGGNLMLFAGNQGGFKLDKRLKTLTSYSAANLVQSPLYYFRRALNSAAANMQASVSRSETRDGILYIRDGRRTYAVRPLSRNGLASVDVMVESDRGRMLIARWRFERVTPDVSRFNPESFTRIEPQASVDPVMLPPRATIMAPDGEARIVNVDVNEKGDIFIGSWSRSNLGFSGKVNDPAAKYSWAPSGVVRSGSMETFREHIFYRKTGTLVNWPIKVDLEVWPVTDEATPRKKLQFTFNKPTCTVIPEFELADQAAENPYIRHRLRVLLYEAAIAETGEATLRITTETQPMKDPEAVINYYRLALTFDWNLPMDFRAYRFSRARLYYELYRGYNATRQRERAQKALLYARQIYRREDPWLEERIVQAMISEDLVEQQ